MGVAATSYSISALFVHWCFGVKTCRYIQIQEYLSDLSSLVSFGIILNVTLLRWLGILERLWFSFPLSHSLSDVRSVSLLAFCIVSAAQVELLYVSSAGAFVKMTAIVMNTCKRRYMHNHGCNKLI